MEMKITPCAKWCANDKKELARELNIHARNVHFEGNTLVAEFANESFIEMFEAFVPFACMLKYDYRYEYADKCGIIGNIYTKETRELL